MQIAQFFGQALRNVPCLQVFSNLSGSTVPKGYWSFLGNVQRVRKLSWKRFKGDEILRKIPK
jgi:hypothetical protein